MTPSGYRSLNRATTSGSRRWMPSSWLPRVILGGTRRTFGKHEECIKKNNKKNLTVLAELLKASAHRKCSLVHGCGVSPERTHSSLVP
uniref:Uncharacterized protein n=1 Tax=Kryptolebias marmoratus TaxID=37003 RepID=A0A3Q3GT54_KRYMA